MNVITKRFGAVLALLAVLTLSACTEEEVGPKPNHKLHAKWETVSTIPSITPSGNALVSLLIKLGYDGGEAEELAASYQDPTVGIYKSIEFRSDGKYIVVEEEGSFSGDWELNEDETVITFDKGKSDQSIGKLTKLTDTELILEMDLTKIFGANDVIKYFLVITMKKV
jgi:hypothetical protein